MSGRKRVLVDEEEWFRLKAAAANLRQVNSQLPELLDGVRRATERQFQDGLGLVRARQSDLERRLVDAGEQVQSLEASTTERLAALASRTEAEHRALEARMVTSVDDLRQQTAHLLEAEHRWAQEALSAERAERTRQVTALQRGLGRLEANAERAGEAARAWLRGARALHDHLRDQLPHERFAPGRLERLVQRLEIAEGNLRDGLGEAATASAQEVYVQLGELRLDVEMREWEWRELRRSTRREVLVLSGLIEQNRMRRAVGRDGVELTTELDVDWWTEGRLSELREEIAVLLQRVDAEQEPPDEEELHRVREQLPLAEARLADITQEAGAAQLASQIRANIAETVVDVLEQNGYHLDGGTYEQANYRAAFVARVTHPDGSEIVVRVTPVPGVGGHGPATELTVQSFDRTPVSDEVRWERARALSDRLRAEGIQVLDPEHVGAPDPRDRDLDLRRLGTPAPVRVQHDAGGAA